MKKSSVEDVVGRLKAEGVIVDNSATPEDLEQERKSGSGALGSSLGPGRKVIPYRRYPRKATPRPPLRSRKK